MKTLLFLVLLFASASAFSQIKITAAEASKHIGDSVSIMDRLYGYKVLDNGMTLLNVGGKYPKQLLTIMIPAGVRSSFPRDIEPFLKDTTTALMVSGKLINYKGKPEIIITSPKELWLMGTVEFK